MTHRKGRTAVQNARGMRRCTKRIRQIREDKFGLETFSCARQTRLADDQWMRKLCPFRSPFSAGSLMGENGEFVWSRERKRLAWERNRVHPTAIVVSHFKWRLSRPWCRGGTIAGQYRCHESSFRGKMTFILRAIFKREINNFKNI